MAALVLTMFVGCDQENIETPNGGSKLEIPYASKTVGAAKGTFVLNVESNVEWTITSSAEWLTTNNTSFSGSAGVLCSYAENTVNKSRTAKLTLTPVDNSSVSVRSLLVTQSASNDVGGDDNDEGNDDGGNDDGGNDDGGNDDGGDDDGGNDDGGDDDGGLVTDGGTRYAGWAELPAEENNSDYYYAYHMRPDKSSQRNFAVCYSASKACPVWVAAVLHECYTGGASRSGYSPDPKIPSNVQVTPRAGDTNKGNWMNRGHMLASNKRTVSSSTNEQVFYYTNIAPQNGNTLNTGGGLWNNLEDYEYDIMCRDTLYSVHGCHWTNNNETFNGQIVPTHFYKVYLRTKKGNTGKWVVNCSESELQCVAFYMPHNVEKCKPSSKYMISVSELEQITGVTFFPNVKNAPKDTYNPSDWGF